MMTFRGFIAKYRALKMANQKGTTVHGYETNIRAHYLPEFGDMQLSEITIEAVQTFLNQKAKEGKAVQTLKNLKWGLSSIFRAAMKYGYMTSNPARGADLPPEGIREQPGNSRLAISSTELIERLKEPISTAVWLVGRELRSVRRNWHSSGKTWLPRRRNLWVVRAVNQGKLHTPKYHRSNRPIRLTEADVERLLALKERMKAQDEDWVFPNRIKKGKTMKPGPIWHETLLARRIQPVAERARPSAHHLASSPALGSDTDGGRACSAQGGAGTPWALAPRHSSQVLRPCPRRSADAAAETLSGQLSGRFSAAKTAQTA